MSESKRYWIRFFSPDTDPRPVKVPAPVEWWHSGTSGSGSAVICALARAQEGEDVDTRIATALEPYWPGLRIDSATAMETWDGDFACPRCGLAGPPDVLATIMAPVPMLLFCPVCGAQHIDAPHGEWTNPPHRSHECQQCQHVWRPADVATTGVANITTKGQRDGVPAPQMQPPSVILAEAERLLASEAVCSIGFCEGPRTVTVVAADGAFGEYTAHSKTLAEAYAKLMEARRGS